MTSHADASRCEPLAGPITVPLTPVPPDPALVGAKASGLSELQRIPGVKVPPAFAITTHAFDYLLAASPGIRLSIANLERLTDPAQIRESAGALQRKIQTATIPQALRTAVASAYRDFSAKQGDRATLVAIRSSGIGEDQADASFAGQYVTILNVRGSRAVLSAVRQVWASAYAPDAVCYAHTHRPYAPPVKMAIIVQKMVQPTAAGTAFSVDLETGAPLISISATWGLGNPVVAGLVTPDLYLVDPHRLTLVKRRLGAKAIKEVYDAERRITIRLPTTSEETQSYTLTPTEVRELALLTAAVAIHYRNTHGIPGVDVEFAIADHVVYLLQSRPETAWTRQTSQFLVVDPELARQAARLLVAGVTGSPGVATGRVCIAASVEEAEAKIAPGDILVVLDTTHSWERLLAVVGAVITDIGGPGGHTGLVMREIKKPALVGTGFASSTLQDGCLITLDATQRTVFSGAVPAIAMPAPSAWVDLSAAPHEVTEDEAWRDACGMTKTSVDLSGLRWIGKPAYPVSTFMQTIYLEAHQQAGARLGIPTHARVFDRIHMVNFSHICRWRERMFAMSLDELETVNQDRKRALASYSIACRQLRPNAGSIGTWVGACVRLNSAMGLSYTIFEAAERLLAYEAFDSQVPALVLLQARQTQAHQMGPSQTTLALSVFSRLVTLARRDDHLRSTIESAASTASLAPLAGADAHFVRQLRRYAFLYKIPEADEPDLALSAVLLVLVTQLAGALSADREPIGLGRVESGLEEFFPESPRLARALRLALEAERARQDSHHLRARGHRLAELHLAPLVRFLERLDQIGGYSDIFTHPPAWLIDHAGRFVQ